MTDLELIFSMLGEAATTEITRADDAKGFHESKHAARRGGEVVGSNLQYTFNKIQKMYNAAPIFTITRKNYLSPSPSICKRKPDNRIRRISFLNIRP